MSLLFTVPIYFLYFIQNVILLCRKMQKKSSFEREIVRKNAQTYIMVLLWVLFIHHLKDDSAINHRLSYNTTSDWKLCALYVVINNLSYETTFFICWIRLSRKMKVGVKSSCWAKSWIRSNSIFAIPVSGQT